MQKLTRWLFPLIGIALIIGGIYLVFKPKIDAYFTKQDNEKKIEQYQSEQKKSTSF
ncbi:sortase A [Staphylococcus schleiferi]|uniref:Sortase A n=1 Tax=Staphylococcus schleiferi TaxID=1295 RepID=A0A7Z7QNB6_STASC|nr:sortase A [Staphylococcus schleiferi]SUM86964.1 sortase A [Staphylococcus schleiferi]